MMGVPSKLSVIRKDVFERVRPTLLFTWADSRVTVVVEQETTDTLYYYESTKRKLKTKYICGCRCYERLQPNTKEFTRLSYTDCLHLFLLSFGKENKNSTEFGTEIKIWKT